MGAFVVIDPVKPVDLLLQLLETVGERLLIEPAEQSLVEAFVLTLCRRLVGFPGDRLDPEGGDVGDELAEHPAAGRGQRGPVIAEQPLRNPVSRDLFRDDRDRTSRGFAPSNMGRDGQAGVIVDELEDHTLPTAGEDIFGAVQLPARVRRRINEPTVRRPRLLLRLHRATPASRKIRANDDTAGTGSIPKERIFS